MRDVSEIVTSTSSADCTVVGSFDTPSPMIGSSNSAASMTTGRAVVSTVVVDIVSLEAHDVARASNVRKVIVLTANDFLPVTIAISIY